MLTSEIIQYARNGNIQEIQRWVSDGNANNLNDKDNDNNTLLGIAILNHQWELASYLVRQNIDTNNPINNTPRGNNISVIEIPMDYDRWDLVEQLIHAGANSQVHYNNISPLNHFAKEGNIGMVNYILGSVYGHPNV